jgi:hypothetical protein
MTVSIKTSKAAHHDFRDCPYITGLLKTLREAVQSDYEDTDIVELGNYPSGTVVSAENAEGSRPRR